MNSSSARLLFSIFFCCITLSTPVVGQSSLPTSARAALDTALAAVGWRFSDLSMPPDLLERDIHRTAFHDSLFSAPFRVLDDVTRITTALRGQRDEDFDAAIDDGLLSMGYGRFRRRSYDLQLTSDQTAQRLGVDPSTYAGFIGSTLLYRYLQSIVLAYNDVATLNAAFRRNVLVFSNADSLWMNTTASESASLWELANEEQRNQKSAEAFFSSAMLPGLHQGLVAGVSLHGQLRAFVRSSEEARDLLSDSVRTVEFETSIGRVALGGPGNDTYVGRYALILDVGGDDTYVVDDGSKESAAGLAVQVIIDLDGNDSYKGKGYAIGAGIGGVGIVIDARGNDVYMTRDFSAGCGLFGCGILDDLSGNDIYIGGQNTQGAGIFGIGVIRDHSGMDAYHAHAHAQGFGATRGLGILHDRSGNDSYTAASPFTDVLRYESHHVTFAQGAALGHRPIASGGIGILSDDAGNDHYSCDIYGQGTAYWFGLGALMDRAGEDRYQAYQYAQGSGVHFANGYLRDEGGDDVYVSHGVSQGCGHDIATGMLIDESGNDIYVAESLSLGAGNANAISLLLDVAGNDSYSAMNASNTMGYSDFRRQYGMLGLFVDAGGRDLYGETTRNTDIRLQSSYGVFADVELSPTSTTASTKAPPSYVDMPLASTADSLLIQASAAPLRFQNNVRPARDRLVELDIDVLELLTQHLGTGMPRVRLTLEDVIPRLHARFPEAVERLITDSLSSTSLPVVSLCAAIASKIKSPAVRQPLAQLSRSADWRFRRIALHALGEANDTASLPMLIDGLGDVHPYVAARAAYHVGRLSSIMALDQLTPSLRSSHHVVRFSAIEGLARGARLPVPTVLAWLDREPDPVVWTSGLRLLAACDTTAEHAAALHAWYGELPSKRRQQMDRILPSLPPFWTAALRTQPVLPAMQGKPKRRAVKSTLPSGLRP